MYEKNGTNFLTGTDEAAKLWREIQFFEIIWVIQFHFEIRAFSDRINN